MLAWFRVVKGLFRAESGANALYHYESHIPTIDIIDIPMGTSAS